ncbi:MAG: hypothetical protein F4003_12430 [Acidimicrobiaceae bacterium]|nr:hypothetical protein [Acidimicrobiaceae bacterium]MYC42560.1 hypothetical protein [Acidimicrobiaceae bacterium]
MSPVRTRVLRGAVAWILILALVGLVVHPENCGEPASAEVNDAAAKAVSWFGANIGDDGTFVYRYDRAEGEPLGGYNDVRHAGVLLSLYQAESAGIEGAAAIADRGLAYVDEHLQHTPMGIAFGRGPTVRSGSIGLLVAALDERRGALGTDDRDALLLELGRTLSAVVEPDGAVGASIDTKTGSTSGRSPFFTGEVLWALARLHLTFPNREFDETALRVYRYLIEDRDRVESPWPPVSDHWGAYALETMSRWPNADNLRLGPDLELDGTATSDWLRRQLNLFGLQVRYESQRQGGLTHLTRGTVALPAGVGTLGEGIGNYLQFLNRFPEVDVDIDSLNDRARCVAHLLVQRQTSASQAQAHRAPFRLQGAWFREDITQMDDQQHALSALLLLKDWMPK